MDFATPSWAQWSSWSSPSSAPGAARAAGSHSPHPPCPPPPPWTRCRLHSPWAAILLTARGCSPRAFTVPCVGGHTPRCRFASRGLGITSSYIRLYPLKSNPFLSIVIRLFAKDHSREAGSAQELAATARALRRAQCAAASGGFALNTADART